MKKEVSEDAHPYGEMQNRYSKKGSGEYSGSAAEPSGSYVCNNSYNGRVLSVEGLILQVIHQEAHPLQGTLCRWRGGKVSAPMSFGFAAYVLQRGQVWLIK